MRFLVDECTGPAVADWLRNQNHEVFSVFEQSRGMNDEDIIQKAATENWILLQTIKILVTRCIAMAVSISASFCSVLRTSAQCQKFRLFPASLKITSIVCRIHLL